jgi:hypothetical protein
MIPTKKKKTGTMKIPSKMMKKTARKFDFPPL